MLLEIATTGIFVAVTIATYKLLTRQRYSRRSYMAGLTQAEKDVERQGLVVTVNNAWDSPLRDDGNFWIDQAWEQGYADYLTSAQAKQANIAWEASQC